MGNITWISGALLGYALCFTGCEYERNETKGEIKSDGHPGPYEDHQNCYYTINILPDHILKINLSVDIPPTPSCRTEFLKLEHGYFAYNRRVCGFLSHISYYIKEDVRSTHFRFRTRDLNNDDASGFEIEFQQFLRSSVSEEEINSVHIGVSGNNTTINYQDRPWWI